MTSPSSESSSEPSNDAADVLLTRSTDGVLLLTLNRPDARNALSPELIAALEAALDDFVADDGLRAAVLTGSGSAFCAGLDLKRFAAAGADRRSASRLIRRFGTLPKPVIGAVNGWCVTGGLELALGLDWLVAGPGAMFADTHLKVGAFPGGGLTARLGRIVGTRTAKAMSLGGLRLDAQAALLAGLVTQVVPEERLVEHAVEQAGRIAAANQDLVRIVRDLHDGNIDRPLTKALAVEYARREEWRSIGPQTWTVQS
ncbi:Enoyl-CoA hydratase [Frankia canadensis]|uniref:Enoyl-CoA hydratase n=1 Tax=Frankia canadensis TaxID=1836972 RepID=A0A2I2KRS4_9ACTN|nr:enoyl-CoA hydratase-related protein [Frankia canadensis]SNQ48365.1 Enoyl-CoA hydratase [Frankia canadensis]SOU55655.1 Enoyl-CoA hydratase [Frankia canadensis]